MVISSRGKAFHIDLLLQLVQPSDHRLVDFCEDRSKIDPIELNKKLFVRQLFIGSGAGACYLFKHFGKAGHAVKSAAEAGFGHAVPQHEASTCVMDAFFTNDLDKGLALPFLKIAAEGGGMHVCEAPGFGKRHRFQEIPIDVGIHGGQAIRYSRGRGRFPFQQAQVRGSGQLFEYDYQSGQPFGGRRVRELPQKSVDLPATFAGEIKYGLRQVRFHTCDNELK